MRQFSAITMACTALLGAAVLFIPTNHAEAQRRPSCSMEKLQRSRAISAERKATSKFTKAERNLLNLERRLDRDVMALENHNYRCENQLTYAEEKFRNQLNRLEDQRLRYLSDAQHLITEAALCNIGGFFNPDSRRCDRDVLLSKANNLARKATQIEGRIASMRDNNNRNMNNIRTRCANKANQIQTTINRSSARVNQAAAAIPALEADAAAKQAARAAAEEALVRCQNPA